MRYYIENERGQMLKSLEYGGDGWTYDPREAWEFEQVPKTEAELGIEIMRNIESKLFFGTERIPSAKTEADPIRAFMLDEGLGAVILQEHSFHKISNSVSEMIPELYRDALTQDMYSIHHGRIQSAYKEHILSRSGIRV